LAIGAGIGAIGGTVDAIIYSVDNQDYSQFFNRVKGGVVIGISAASLGAAMRAVINYKPLQSSKLTIEEKYQLVKELAEQKRAVREIIDQHPEYETTFI
jgi:hypothetical protein